MPRSTYGINYKDIVIVGNDRGSIFFSEEVIAILTDISEICFDETFYTVPIQFYQLWTIFIVVNTIKKRLLFLLHTKNLESCSENKSCIQ